MNQYKVSVIIPVYNVEEYLEECLMSVVHQTIDSLQVIMVDDGSLDGSSDIAKQFANQYNHFEYVLQENGGLGNARNTGVKYATGEYIVFLDSDDVVPDYAYEKMYEAAKRDGSDMAIGAVARFNSKRDMLSNLHDFAFADYNSVDNIRDNPHLIYDTTSWNKLIRKDFWDRHEFKFPERILYEDIPVTIPMHYLVNHVSMVYDICYMWRVRDGANKSITQRADDFTNLHDRITVMRMVDQFFKDNVTEDALWKEKHYKWLFTDLMVFVNSCLYMTDDKMKEMMAILRDYINEAIPIETIDKLPILYREKYKAVMADDAKRLTEVRDFENRNFGAIKIKKKGKDYIGKFPNNFVPEEESNMNITIDKWKLIQLVERVNWKEDKCVIEGYAFIWGIQVKKPSDKAMQAYLFNPQTGEKIPLQTESIESPYAQKKFGFKLNNETKEFSFLKYKGAGYRITIDAEELREKQLQGDYFIWITYDQDGWHKESTLRGIMKTVRVSLDKRSYLKNHMYVQLHATHRFELKFEIQKDLQLIENCEFKKDTLDIIVNRELEQLYVSQDKYNGQELNAEIQGKEIQVSLNDIPDGKGYLSSKDGLHFVPLLKEEKNSQFVTRGNEQFLRESYRDFRNYLSRSEVTPVLENISDKDGIFVFDISKVILDADFVPEKAELYVEDPQVEGRIVLGEAEVLIKDNSFHTQFTVDFNDNEITKNLYAKKRKVHLSYKNGDKEANYVIKKKMMKLDRKFLTKERRFRVVLPKDDCLHLNTKRIGGFLTRSKKKRDFTDRFIYPLLRLLPLKKKTIVFESMWGTKFSCNPRHLYEYIDKNHPDYECVWVLKDECTPITGNGIRVRRLSFKYLYYMARAKYFVNNVNFHDSYVKRKGQVEVQTMHGTPLKTIGLDVPGDFPTKRSIENYLKKCNRWDYLTVQSKFVADLAPSAFRFEKEIMDTGYPRTDILYEKNNPIDIMEIKEKLGLPTDKKIIMYAPTWRVRNRFDLMLDLEEMKKRFSDEYVLILRLHHFSAAGWDGVPADGFVYDLTDYQSIEDLYIITDVLITDYSSVMFDYAVLNRPMLFFTYDLDDYRDKLRGFNIDIEKEAPGPLLFTSEEVLDTIENLDQAMEQVKDRVQAFNEHYIGYECANSSEKVFCKMTGRN